MKFEDIPVGTAFRTNDKEFCLRVAGTEFPWIKVDDRHATYVGRPNAGLAMGNVRWHCNQRDLTTEKGK